MQKRSRKPRQPQDVNQAAFEMVARSTGQSEPAPKLTKSEISRFMTAMGRRGGKKGGKNRWANVSAEDRSKALSAAAKARWGKHTEKEGNGDGDGI
jgi:hypothetical protein